MPCSHKIKAVAGDGLKYDGLIADVQDTHESFFSIVRAFLIVHQGRKMMCLRKFPGLVSDNFAEKLEPVVAA